MNLINQILKSPYLQDPSRSLQVILNYMNLYGIPYLNFTYNGSNYDLNITSSQEVHLRKVSKQEEDLKYLEIIPLNSSLAKDIFGYLLSNPVNVRKKK